MDFWNDQLTEKSWNLLLEIKKQPFDFVLIGGWAAYLWAKLHKSKDIDIVLASIKDIDYLKSQYDLRKDDNLKKYEIKFGEIGLDIYVPFYSKLAIPPEDIKNLSTKIENIMVAIPEALLILKQGAELDRKASVKGQKDRVDIMALLCFVDIDFKKYNELLEKYHLGNFRQRLKEIINGFAELQYLNLNPREFKLKKKELLKKI